jgi:Domain of Unknown Function (DUF1080).
VTGTRAPAILSSLGENKELAAHLTSGWNSIHLICRDNILIHTINGHMMSVVIDDDTANRTLEGLLGVQVHVGGPMKVEYRGWRVKNV